MIDNLFSLNGKTAIVTGAAGLLGRQHCFALSEAGANVVLCDLDIEKCNSIAYELPTKSLSLELDITSEYSILAVSEKIYKEFGSIDILVNNAAINDMVENDKGDSEPTSFENYPISLFRKVLDVNITGMFASSKIFGAQMVRQGKGSIINIASTYGVVAPDQNLYIKPDGTQSFFKSPAYPTAKAAVLNFTRYLAAYWGKHGIRVNSLSPGGVENGQEQFFIDNYSKRTPLGRMSKSTDYHGGLIFLASDASLYMTGANLVIDGGWTIW
jgi:NAD(P)-dependent dehydrogenase (short-subunit alcohol dehydrogenase family)